MNSFDLPKSMDKNEKSTLLSQLQSLIDQTYSVEKEYIGLTHSYNQLQNIIKEIIEALPNALWILNSDGTIFLDNSEAKKLSSMLETIDLNNREQQIQYANRNYIIKRSSQEEKTVISATDITEQKRKERLASMGQMAAHLAHEIRNPIGSITLLISSLSKRVTPKNQPIVEEIRRSLFRVERIIKSTLMYSKGLQPIFLNKSIKILEKECQDAIHSYSYTKNITFHYDLPDISLKADFNLLSLALQNLIFNAIDAIEEDENDIGDIWLEASKYGEKIIFKIKDSGVPIRNKDNLFEAFHTTKTKGNGLGLVLSKQIIEIHKGTIDISEYPKYFIITLPII